MYAVEGANLRPGASAWYILQASVPAHLRREPRAEEWFRYRDLYAMGQRDLGMEPILERKRSVNRFVYFLRVPPRLVATCLVSYVRGWGGVLFVSVYLSESVGSSRVKELVEALARI